MDDLLELWTWNQLTYLNNKSDYNLRKLKIIYYLYHTELQGLYSRLNLGEKRWNLDKPDCWPQMFYVDFSLNQQWGNLIHIIYCTIFSIFGPIYKLPNIMYYTY